MVRLTRLNNQTLIINSDLIKFVEQAPDTLITLINGEKFIVRENTDEVVRLVVEFRRSVQQAGPSAWNRERVSVAATTSVEAAAQDPGKR